MQNGCNDRTIHKSQWQAETEGSDITTDIKGSLLERERGRGVPERERERGVLDAAPSRSCAAPSPTIVLSQPRRHHLCCQNLHFKQITLQIEERHRVPERERERSPRRRSLTELRRPIADDRPISASSPPSLLCLCSERGERERERKKQREVFDAAPTNGVTSSRRRRRSLPPILAQFCHHQCRLQPSQVGIHLAWIHLAASSPVRARSDLAPPRRCHHCKYSDRPHSSNPSTLRRSAGELTADRSPSLCRAFL
ncbi:hypothetical protein PIB30_084453 [Stylosanthes scabra]|uniref:Uncharacterized protein n=1 Tax=Stylosanthes scabra TaxID=79078 RepID=A0ABU6QS39_9FABA|nr:hypothetical protein [Stylosanthes scabra]